MWTPERRTYKYFEIHKTDFQFASLKIKDHLKRYIIARTITKDPDFSEHDIFNK